MSKYGESLGVWDLTVGRSKEMGALQLHPTHKDNRKLLSIITDERIKQNQDILLDKIGIFVKEMIAREYPPENDSERKDLDEYVETYLLQLMTEVMITFKLAKREELESAKKGLLPVR